MLAEAYPIARGSSPMLVTLGAAVAAGERPGPAALIGIGLVCAGIFGIALGGRRVAVRSMAWALACGAMIAAYTLTDGLGARRSLHAVSYAAWLFAAQGVGMIVTFIAVRRSLPRIAWADNLQSLLGGLLQLIAYGVVIWALSVAPMGQVSALRETGILFAMVIGVLFLKERPRPHQLLAGLAVAAGAAVLSTS
jgi:drug/metabolite transporter (DMT)-like permease